MVMADILPLAVTEPAILADRNGFLANGIAFKKIHISVSFRRLS